MPQVQVFMKCLFENLKHYAGKSVILVLHEVIIFLKNKRKVSADIIFRRIVYRNSYKCKYIYKIMKWRYILSHRLDIICHLRSLKTERLGFRVAVGGLMLFSSMVPQAISASAHLYVTLMGVFLSLGFLATPWGLGSGAIDPFRVVEVETQEKAVVASSIVASLSRCASVSRHCS